MTDFLWDVGTNGYIATPFDAMSSETGLNALASGGAILSTVLNSDGHFDDTETANAPLCDIYIQAGGAFTPIVGGSLAIWFERSKDGGSTYEFNNISNASTTVPALARAPDAIVPLNNVAYASGNLAVATDILLPVGTNKTVIQNLSGTTINVNHVIIAPKALKY